MKKIILSIAIITLAVVTFAGGKEGSKNATKKAVSFKVVDANNESIAGAEVSIKNLGIVSYTDMEGNYSIELPASMNEEIIISFISFKDKTIQINNINDGIITLVEEE